MSGSSLPTADLVYPSDPLVIDLEIERSGDLCLFLCYAEGISRLLMPCAQDPRWHLHDPRRGVHCADRHVDQSHRCVASSLRHVDGSKFSDDPLLFPLPLTSSRLPSLPSGITLALRHVQDLLSYPTLRPSHITLSRAPSVFSSPRCRGRLL